MMTAGVIFLVCGFVFGGIPFIAVGIILCICADISKQSKSVFAYYKKLFDEHKTYKKALNEGKVKNYRDFIKKQKEGSLNN